MDSSFSERLQSWLSRVSRQGWMDEKEIETLFDAGEEPRASLFSRGEKPLVVAFFGGTGVGKSTLLNRLAGEEVARTGIERPTSREVTVYLHHTLPREQIQARLPWERVRIAAHHNDHRRNVVWIDMPDIDSVERGNRELVLQCIPHVDVLLYVVSPERYRDDSGWRLLREQAQKHAWLFVMNKWDQGDEIQIEDFVSLLRQDGFADPLVIRCDSRQNLAERKPDDFGKLEEIISRLEHSGGVERLASHQRQLMQQTRHRQIRQVLQHIGEPGRLDQVAGEWKKLWKETLVQLEPSLQWSAQSLAIELTGKKKRQADLSTPGDALSLDLWARKSLADSLDRLTLEAARQGLPTAPLKRRLEGIQGQLEARLQQQVQRFLRQALARPGRRWRRAMLWIFGGLRYLLPLAASGWVAWQVVLGYYRGFQHGDGFLGVDFAVHSLLLIGLAWLIPFLSHRLLQPSVEKAAAAGIRQGYQAGLEKIDREVNEILLAVKTELETLRAEGDELLARLGSEMAIADERPNDPLLERMMIHKPS